MKLAEFIIPNALAALTKIVTPLPIRLEGEGKTDSDFSVNVCVLLLPNLRCKQPCHMPYLPRFPLSLPFSLSL